VGASLNAVRAFRRCRERDSNPHGPEATRF
jgi:hypothetical protein